VIIGRTLTGKLVRLVPLRMEHADILTRWNADAEVRHWLHRSEDPPELLSRAEVGRRVAQGLSDPSEVHFMIEAGRRLIGEIRLREIHPCGRAELAILIGEKDQWSRGYGGDAIRALLRLAFGELELRRVTLITDVDNARGIRCYERCGFRHEGLLRAHRLRYGAPLDMCAMGVLREEFLAADGDERGR
jgi:RimJ/RimL family protein N-acetyltransferase